MPQMTRDRRER